MHWPACAGVPSLCEYYDLYGHNISSLRVLKHPLMYISGPFVRSASPDSASHRSVQDVHRLKEPRGIQPLRILRRAGTEQDFGPVGVGVSVGVGHLRDTRDRWRPNFEADCESGSSGDSLRRFASTGSSPRLLCWPGYGLKFPNDLGSNPIKGSFTIPSSK